MGIAEKVNKAITYVIAGKYDDASIILNGIQEELLWYGKQIDEANYEIKHGNYEVGYKELVDISDTITGETINE